MKMWFNVITGAVLLVTLLLSKPAIAEIEQSGRSGQPLSVFCNVAPELSTQRSDSVDNWVRICSLWLNHNHSCKAKPPRGKKIGYTNEQRDSSRPGFQLIHQQ